jgi:hypothetical protein
MPIKPQALREQFMDGLEALMFVESALKVSGTIPGLNRSAAGHHFAITSSRPATISRRDGAAMRIR